MENNQMLDLINNEYEMLGKSIKEKSFWVKRQSKVTKYLGRQTG